MMTWSFEETVETNATAEKIWKIWSTTETWPQWDSGIEWIKLEGRFEKGSRGVMKPSGGPKVKFELQEVEVNKRFRDRSFLPLTSLDFIHTYSPAALGRKATITHRVEMKGFLTPLFSRVIGTNLKKGLPDAMGKLVALAERNQ